MTAILLALSPITDASVRGGAARRRYAFRLVEIEAIL
jgi:hypothetical protein